MPLHGFSASCAMRAINGLSSPKMRAMLFVLATAVPLNAASADIINVALWCNGTYYGTGSYQNCPTLAGTPGMVNGAGGTSTDGALEAGVNFFVTTLTPGTLNTTLGYTGVTGNNPPPPNSFPGPGGTPLTAISNPEWTVPVVEVSLTLNGFLYFPPIQQSGQPIVDIIGANWHSIGRVFSFATRHHRGRTGCREL